MERLLAAFLLALCLFLNSCASTDKSAEKQQPQRTTTSQQAGSETANLESQSAKSVTNAASSEPIVGMIKKRLTNVNVRPEPSTRKPPVAKLTGGDKVEIIGQVGSWLKIRFGSDGSLNEGWISNKLIERQGSPKNQ